MKAFRILWILLCCVATGGAAQEVSTYGPVRPNETLYRIALEHRHAGMTVEQMMTSIFERNPQAFEQNDMNLLKVGAVLRIPSADTREPATKQAADSSAMPPAPSPAPAVPLGVDSAAPAGQQGAPLAQAEAGSQPLVLPPPKPPARKKKEAEPFDNENRIHQNE